MASERRTSFRFVFLSCRWSNEGFDHSFSRALSQLGSAPKRRGSCHAPGVSQGTAARCTAMEADHAKASAKIFWQRKAAPSFRAPAPIDRSVFADHHAGQELPGRVSVNVNSKPPHAGQELPGRVSVNVRSGTKTFSPKTRRSEEYQFYKSVSDLPTSRMS